MNRPSAPPSSSPPLALIAVVLAILIGLGIWYWWPRDPALSTPPADAALPPVAQTAPEAPLPPELPASPVPPTIENPIEEAPVAASAPDQALPSLERSDEQVGRSLRAMFGRDPVLTWLQTDHFVQRVVTTVDNLGRDHAAPQRWPVNPVAGRFSVSGSGAEARISDANAQRYADFLAFVRSVDPARVAALYKGSYPLYQQAYEELGYPGRHFNDRVVEVIDLLLATPTPPEPPRVTLTEVKGPVPSERPWVRYEYADTTLEARPAGQKIMLRLSPAQQQLVRSKLIALRGQIASSKPPAGAAAR